LPEDAPVDPGDASVAVVGMGRLGGGVYDTLRREYGDVLLGIDIDPDRIAKHEAAGRNMLLADVTDDELWERAKAGRIEVAVLALHEHAEKLCVISKIRRRNEQVKIFAVADYPEEIDALKEAGAHAVWNLYSEVGVGFAEEVIRYCSTEEA
jgi:Trk K+ transport system NAD-binding subunit